MTRFNTFLREEEGAALAEYGLLVALIAVVCIAAVTALGTKVAAKLNQAAEAISPTPAP